MRQPPQRSLDAADNDGNVREQTFENLRVDRHGTVGPKTGLAAGRISVVVAQTQVGGIMVDHRIHRTGRDAEKQTRHPQLGEIAQIVAPVGLRHDSDAIPLGFE